MMSQSSAHGVLHILRTPATVVLVIGSLLIGCAGSSDPGTQGAAEPGREGEDASSSEVGSVPSDLVDITVGVVATADAAPLYLGIAEGYFEDEGLNVEAVVAEGGAAVIPAVVSGDFDIGYSNIVSLVFAQSQGIDVRLVTGGAVVSGTEGEGYIQVVVAEGGEVNDYDDLQGRTLGVNTLRNINDLAMRTALEARGLDPDSITFTEVPFPDMNAAVEGGQIDAALSAEPFLTLGEGTIRGIGNPYIEIVDPYMYAYYFASADFLGANGDIAERFSRAMSRALDQASSDEESVREVIGTYTQMDDVLIQELALPEWGPDIDEASLDATIARMLEFDFIDQPIDGSSMAWRQG